MSDEAGSSGAGPSPTGAPSSPECEDARETVARLRLLIDQIPGFLAMTDAQGRYLLVNRMYLDAFGRPVEEIEGRHYREVLPEELWRRHESWVKRCLAGEEVPFDDVLPLDEARPTQVHGVYRPIFGPDGKVRYLTVVSMDITDRVMADEALRRSEERLRLIASLLEEAVGIRDADTLETVYMSPAYETLTGRTVQSLLDDPESLLSVVYPPDRSLVEDWVKGGRDQLMLHEIRFRLVRTDGQVRWVWARAVPVLGEDGHPTQWVTSTKDVTDWKRAEDALIAEKERLSVTLASIGEGVVTTDVEGRVVMLNEVAQRMTGWTGAEAAGQPLDVVYRLATGPHPPGEDGLGHGERRLLTARDGRVVPVEQRVSPIRGGDGRVQGQVIVVRDISEMLRLEDERIQAQKLESLAVLAGGIAHDFNNLLTGIQGNLSLALTDPAMAADVRGWLEDAAAAAERSQGLTQQLLTFARGGAPVRKVSDIRESVHQSATFAGRGASVVCRVEAAHDLWPVDADLGQIGQVVQNLVLNAIEASPAGAEVRVECVNARMEEDNDFHLAPGPYVCLRVVDRGSGIPEEILQRIFDPYFSTKKRRSGLGLAISHSVVIRHGGRILVRSTPGIGTTFEVFLPAEPEAAEPAAASGRAAAMGSGSILVMDDDPFVRRVCERTLAFLGYQVVTAPDGREAVDLYRQALGRGARFDVVLMDLTVPGGVGGVEAMAALRELDPGVRAIVMSGYSDNPVMSRYAEHGFVSVLPKPFTVERLHEALALARLSHGGHR